MKSALGGLPTKPPQIEIHWLILENERQEGTGI